jgi:hypothetical protein
MPSKNLHFACNLRLIAVRSKGKVPAARIQVWTFDERGMDGGPLLVDVFDSIRSLRNQANQLGWKYVDLSQLGPKRRCKV